MKKLSAKWMLLGVLAVCVLAVLLYFLWPRSLVAAVGREPNWALVTVSDTSEGEALSKTDRWSELPPEAVEQIRQVLESYSYHLCPAIFFNKGNIDNGGNTVVILGGTDYYLHMFNGNAHIFLSESHSIVHLGYFGHKKAAQLCEELTAILREFPPDTQEQQKIDSREAAQGAAAP